MNFRKNRGYPFSIYNPTKNQVFNGQKKKKIYSIVQHCHAGTAFSDAAVWELPYHFFRPWKHVKKTEKLYQWKDSKSWCSPRPSLQNKPGWNTQHTWRNDWYHKRNRIFRNGTISGYVVAGFDGAELFSSTKKSCPNCLTRKKLTGETEYFHRSVVCMTIGKSPHVILGQEMLKPRDLSGFEMEGCPYKLRVVRYREQWEEKGGKPNVLCGL